MSTTIEQLELEVQSNATSAVSGIDALASSLGKLKTATKGGVGLTAVAKQLSTLNTALGSISNANIGKLGNLNRALQTLSSLGKIKVSSSIASQITNLGGAVRGLGGTDFSVLNKLANSLVPLTAVGKANLNSFISQLTRLPQAVQALSNTNIGGLGSQIKELVSALTPLTQMGKNNLTSFITQLIKLPTAVQSLKSVNISELSADIRELANAFKPLADEMNKIAMGFSALPSRLQKLIQQTDSMTAANNRSANSFTNLAAKVGVALIAVQRAARVIASWITKSNEYIESLNLFTVSLGEYAEEAQKYAETVSEIVGIDPGEWLRNQGIFMTLASGFGVVSDRAYVMSKNLTQLGYDLSSFFNISYEDAFQKLQSGISGELEPLRRLGFDLSVARLQQEAYTLGIEKSVNAMTQAEKAELRYYAIMTQVTTAQGDMARTLNAPANQLRVLQAQVTQCARALGNIFIPALNAVLPYAIAFAKVIRLIANVISSLFGFKLPEVDYSGLNVGAGGAADMADNLGNAAKKAKELKTALLGIDELNVIAPPEDSGAGGAGGIGGAGGLGFELPEYDFLGDAITSKVDEIVKKMKDWLGLTDDIDSWAELFDTRLGKILKGVIAIGTGLAAWKIAKNVIQFLDKLKNLKGFGNAFGSIGLLSFIADLNEFMRYFDDFVKNGATFRNVAGMLSEFAGMVGDALIMLGSLKVGGALKIVQGIGEIVANVKDIADNGLNWENALSVVRGLTNIAIGIGVLTGNIKLAAWSVALQGFTTVIREIATNWEAIKQGDWSGVDKVTLIIGGLELLGGLVVALDVFSKIKGIANVGQATTAVQTVTTATETLDTTTSTLSPKLSSLAKNIGMGVLILGEVAAGAVIFAGAIAVVGWELSKVAEAWQPVIDNAGAVAIAVGVGTGLLVGIGAATYALGTAGKTVALNVGIGTAILLELGVATGLFIVEVWAIGEGLQKIGGAWQPVLDNGETIAKGIGIGTGLLVGIGVVTAALGAATVATAGALPLAIGLGTALLVELAAAFVLFTESLVAVAKELSSRLSPALADLNTKLPALTIDMSSFVDFMVAFAGEVVRYTGASTIAGLSATIDTIVDWFTQDPIDKLTNEVEKIAGQAQSLNDNLEIANPELQTAIRLLNNYTNFIDELGNIAGSGGTVKLSEGLKVNLKEVGSNIVTGFNEGIKSKYSTIQSTIKTWGTDVQKWFTNSSYGGVNREKFATFAGDIINGFKNKISSSYSESKSGITTWATNVKNWFTNKSYGGVNRETFEKYAKDIIDGFKNGVANGSESAKSGITTWANNTKRYFTDIVSYNAFYDIGKDVVRGFNNGVNDLYYTTRSYMRAWAADAKAAFKAELDSNSPSKVFERIGFDTVLGYNNGIASLGKTTKSVVDSWAKSFTSVSPVMSFAVDTSALRYYSSDSFAKDVSTEFTSSRSYSIAGFKEGMEEFYHEFIEPTMNQMAEDVRRQADKKEQTVVQVGNRVISDAVTTQQKANGYVFVK